MKGSQAASGSPDFFLSFFFLLFEEELRPDLLNALDRKYVDTTATASMAAVPISPLDSIGMLDVYHDGSPRLLCAKTGAAATELRFSLNRSGNFGYAATIPQTRVAR